MDGKPLFRWRHAGSGDHCALCALVSAVCAQLPRPRGDHGRTRTVGRPHDHLLLRSGVGEALSSLSASTTNDSWRVDETYIKVKGTWMYLYRAVDSQGNTLEFLLSSSRDAQSAKSFFTKALGVSHTVTPRAITVDKNAAYPKAFQEMQAAETRLASCEIRQSKYLNNLVEQDHRFIKRLVKPGMGFFLFETAQSTLQGYEVMNMIREGQVQGVNRGDSLS